MTLAIEAVGLVKRFGKTLAVDGVDLAVRPGMVLGLLRPNGAGGPPRHRDVRGNRVPPLPQPRHPDLGRRLADRDHRAIPVAEAAARQPDLAEHGRERHAEPQRLLPVDQPPGQSGRRGCIRSGPRPLVQPAGPPVTQWTGGHLRSS
jgi:hypothetical protein